MLGLVSGDLLLSVDAFITVRNRGPQCKCSHLDHLHGRSVCYQGDVEKHHCIPHSRSCGLNKKRRPFHQLLSAARSFTVEVFVRLLGKQRVHSLTKLQRDRLKHALSSLLTLLDKVRLFQRVCAMLFLIR